MWEPGNATSEVCNQCSSYLLGTTAQWLWSDSGGGVKVTLSFYCRVYNMIVRISISKCHSSISLSLNSLAIGNTIFLFKLLMLMVTQNCTSIACTLINPIPNCMSHTFISLWVNSLQICNIIFQFTLDILKGDPKLNFQSIYLDQSDFDFLEPYLKNLVI